MKLKNRNCLFVLLFPLFLSCADRQQPQSEDESSWKVGVALYSFNRFPFFATLDKADSAGVEYVEGFDFHQLGEGFSGALQKLPDTELEKIKSGLNDKGMSMPSIYVSSAKTPEDWIAYFELGKRLGLQFLVCEPEKEHWDLLDSLGGAYGIKIAIHEHARGKSRYWHPDSVLAALEGRPNIGACADLGHWVRSGLDPVEALQALTGRIISVHAKDLDEAGNLEANDVKVGSGVIDYPEVVAELEKQGFDGIIYIECEHDWFHNLDDVSFAVKYLDSLKTN